MAKIGADILPGGIILQNSTLNLHIGPRFAIGRVEERKEEEEGEKDVLPPLIWQGH